MNNRLLKVSGVLKDRPATARHHVATVLSKEILNNPAPHTFRIESEHQLCRRFGISRVTVRLALGDLENRGLIFREQGRGTFAHGGSTRVHRLIAILLKAPQSAENGFLVEFLRGVQTITRPLRTSIVLIGHSPEEWRPELVSILAGVIVMPGEVTTEEMENLKNRRLPFLIVGESKLPGPRILLDQTGNLNFEFHTNSSFVAGQRAAEALNLAALTGEVTLNLTPPRHQSVTF
jgi:hypothetical protein